MINKTNFALLSEFCLENEVQLIAVSKTKPVEDIQELYHLGQRAFGENRVQELISKAKELPEDIDWHLIGQLQRNKVKQIVSIVHLIHSVDSSRLLETIQKEAEKVDTVCNILLQFKIATEDTKAGLQWGEAKSIIEQYNDGQYPNICLKGVMGMASFVSDEQQLTTEFKTLIDYFEKAKEIIAFNTDSFSIKSMGMSGDYKLATQCGSNMIRVGSYLFGSRN